MILLIVRVAFSYTFNFVLLAPFTVISFTGLPQSFTCDVGAINYWFPNTHFKSAFEMSTNTFSISLIKLCFIRALFLHVSLLSLLAYYYSRYKGSLTLFEGSLIQSLPLPIPTM
jgi:hypothetical protein